MSESKKSGGSSCLFLFSFITYVAIILFTGFGMLGVIIGLSLRITPMMSCLFLPGILFLIIKIFLDWKKNHRWHKLQWMMTAGIVLFSAIFLWEQIGTYIYNKDCLNRIAAGADLKYCDFSERDMKECDLSGANLTSSNLTNTNLSGCDLSGADMSNASLEGADLSGSNLSSTNLTGVKLKNVNLEGATITNAVWKEVDWVGVKGASDQFLAEALGADITQLEEILIEESIQLESDEDMAKQLAEACQGKAVPGTALFVEGDKPYAMIILEESDYGYKIVDELKVANKPGSLRQTQLVVCISKEQIQEHTCNYEGGTSFEIENYYRTVSIVSPSNGFIVESLKIDGKRETCPLSIPSGSAWKRYGSKVPIDKIEIPDF